MEGKDTAFCTKHTLILWPADLLFCSTNKWLIAKREGYFINSHISGLILEKTCETSFKYKFEISLQYKVK
jgi:hypothetical protein